MLEIKVNIEATAPDLSAAIEKLAVALKGSVVLLRITILASLQDLS